jgi:chemosensory pili system protein ChpA (sensor histidine kinase/response regulator)
LVDVSAQGEAETQPEPEVTAEAEAEVPADEQFKVVGDLRIGIPLFNIFLNEADEQSRRLTTALNEWALEVQHPVSDEAIALAHSLAGNSGAVGYTDLSKLARLLEHALMRSQALGAGDAEAATLFNEAAEESSSPAASVRCRFPQVTRRRADDPPGRLRARSLSPL